MSRKGLKKPIELETRKKKICQKVITDYYMDYYSEDRDYFDEPELSLDPLRFMFWINE